VNFLFLGVDPGSDVGACVEDTNEDDLAIC